MDADADFLPSRCAVGLEGRGLEKQKGCGPRVSEGAGGRERRGVGFGRGGIQRQTMLKVVEGVGRHKGRKRIDGA
jgi:hypothetical protein